MLDTIREYFHIFFYLQQSNATNINSDFDSVELQSNGLIGSSIIYGILTLAVQKDDKSQCYDELKQIINGINRKDIWAIKGSYEFCLFAS